jgi:chemotaxis response regulator CheB
MERLEVLHLDSSDPRVLERIAEVDPDAIIIDANDGQMAADSFIAKILKMGSARVFSLNSNSDEISIFHREQRMASTGDDLLAVIEDQKSRG